MKRLWTNTYTPHRLRSFLSLLVAMTMAAAFPVAARSEAGEPDGFAADLRYDLEVTLAVGSGPPAEDSAAEGDALHAESVARHREYLRGLTASYRMNAYVDYRIAGAITRFVTDDGTREDGTREDGTREDGTRDDGTRADGAGRDGALGSAGPVGPPREVVERTQVMRADLPEAGSDSEQTQRLLVRAFTQRHLNGYADLMWARWIERMNRLEPVHREEWYGAAAESRRPDLLFWTYLLRGSVEPVADFVEEYESFTLSGDAVVEEIIYVQHANRAANEAVLDELRHAMEALPGRGVPASEAGKGGAGVGEAPLTRKSALLIGYAGESPYPREFLRGAVAAQRGAGRWDGAFETLLRWRF